MKYVFLMFKMAIKMRENMYLNTELTQICQKIQTFH